MKLYNSKTGKLEKFTPINNKKVLMYVCGITPYDTTHSGHAFTYVFFDTLYRYLIYKGYKVAYVQNVTDIDDDILKRAKEIGQNWKELGDFWTKRFLDDMKSLNVCPPTHFVKATDSITMIIRIIRVLIEKGFAYQKNGNIYFEVNKFKDYGKFSCLNKKQMILIVKERGGNPDDPLKKDPLDFLLWQSASRRTKPDEPSWQSPWGRGRPGWHIECSAMINQYLGDRIDIHGGGKDLIFPHHESEIAQSQSYMGKKPFVKYWMHCSMVVYKGEKMSKSLGNLVMITDLLKRYSANAIRLMLLSHHYREPWEFEESELKFCQKNALLIKKTVKLKSSQNKKSQNHASRYLKRFEDSMENDLNTPKAIWILNLLSKKIIRDKKQNVFVLQSTLKICLRILGLTLTFLFFLTFFLTAPKSIFAVENPLNTPNNKFGIHILFPEELKDAAKLVNSNGGDWGYVTIPIQAGDKDLLKWQKFMDEAKVIHIIPIIRLATEGDYFNTKVWRKPNFADVLDFSNFLDSLFWPTKNRYIIVLNEPNRADEWEGAPSPFEYASILSYAVSTFKSKNKDFFIISAGLDNAAETMPGKSYNEYDFLRLMNQAVPGIFSQIDGLGSHSYPNPGFSQPPSKQDYESIASFRYEKSLVKSLGALDIPVFITETGWSQDFVPDNLASSYFKEAFEGVWSDKDILAVTPFLLRAGGRPFNIFSFLTKDGSESLRYKAIWSLPKTAGKPILSEDFASTSGVLGQNTNSLKNLEAKDFSESSNKQVKTLIFITPAIKDLIKWLLKI